MEIISPPPYPSSLIGLPPTYHHALKNKNPCNGRRLITCLPLNWRKGVVLKTNGVVTEGMFPWNQVRYIGSMSHSQRHRDEHGDYVYTAVGMEHSCRREGKAYGLCYYII